MTDNPVLIEDCPSLAEWLGVEEVALVREDKLPDQGGKKRRSLERFAREHKDLEHLHLLSYAGSHTAFTLSRLLPRTLIHLYGTRYGGGPYEQHMTQILDQQHNVIQRTGSNLAMTLAFQSARSPSRSGHFAMKVGGALPENENTTKAIESAIERLGRDHVHVVAVASGDLLRSLLSQTSNAIGVLTQPLLIRLWKFISLESARGLRKAPLDHRIELMKNMEKMTGSLWDPIFMGTVLTYLKAKRKLPQKLCIWVTCPGGISWLDTETS